MDEKSIKENIRMIRRRKGLTQDFLAESLQIARASYSNIESGPVRIIHAKVCELAPLLGVSLEELLLGYEPDRDASLRLNEAVAEYDTQYRRLQEEFTGKLEERSSEVATLQDLVETQKATIRMQDEIIAMLKRRISEETISEN